MGKHHGSLKCKRSSVLNCVSGLGQQGAHTVSPQCVNTHSLTHSLTYLHTNTHHVIHIHNILTARLARRHKLTMHYVDSTSSDIQHHPGLLFKLIDQIHSRLYNIRKQSQYKPLLIVAVTVSITHKSASRD